MKQTTLDTIAMILLIIGGLNLGYFGVMKEDVIGQIFTSSAYIVYVLIGLAALYKVGCWLKTRK